VATDAGEESTGGMTCPVPFLWERVIDPSELGHTTTMEEPAILLPVPLKCMIRRWKDDMDCKISYMLIQPTWSSAC
jgi:hypothetical protein